MFTCRQDTHTRYVDLLGRRRRDGYKTSADHNFHVLSFHTCLRAVFNIMPSFGLQKRSNSISRCFIPNTINTINTMSGAVHRGSNHSLKSHAGHHERLCILGEQVECIHSNPEVGTWTRLQELDFVVTWIYIFSQFPLV